MANIGSILLAKSVTSAFDGARVLFLTGAIERDEDSEKFRLYSSPSNKRSFFLVDTNSVAGDIYEWTAEEVAQGPSPTGQKMYTVPIVCGSVIQSVTIENIRLGCAAFGLTGDRAQILWAQSCLARVLDPSIMQDGILGPNTRAAIMQFQQQQSLPPTGMLDPETLAALRAACSGKMPTS